ncbi:MAG: hypothetical protein M5U30_15775 [Burkholderiaceae bacterium]|nr:hypothetical protein [Burkholderiaceae bacterium]
MACSETFGTIDQPGRTIGKLKCGLATSRQPSTVPALGAPNRVASSIVSTSKPPTSRSALRSCTCGTRSYGPGRASRIACQVCTLNSIDQLPSSDLAALNWRGSTRCELLRIERE